MNYDFIKKHLLSVISDKTMVKLVKGLEFKSNKQTHNIHKHKQFGYGLKGFKSRDIYKQIYEH